MAVVGVIVAFLVIITWRPHTQVVQQVDLAATVATAREQAPFQLAVPEEIPSGFSPTNARFEAESYGQPGQVRWFVSYVNEGGEYMSIWQSSGPAKKVIRAATNNGTCSEELTINNQNWQRCQTVKPQTRSLVFKSADYVVVVSGTAAWPKLENLAESTKIQ